MKNNKILIVVSIILLPFIFGFINSNTSPANTHPYVWQFDTTRLHLPAIPADNPMTTEGVELGRLLFYDSLLSKNNKQSCGSCHQQKHSFSDGRKLAIGTFGDTLERNAISLVDLAWSKQFFWDGRIKTLEDVMAEPLFNSKEMGETEEGVLLKLNNHPYYPILFERAFGNKTITIKNVSKAMAQFLRTIVAKPIDLPEEVLNKPPKGVSEYEYTMQNLDSATTRGTYFRFALMCGACHNNDAYGFDDGMATNMVNDRTKLMKIPALINVLMTPPYMHDGRFKTIEEVFIHYSAHIDSLIEINPQLNISSKYGKLKVTNLISSYDMKNAYKFFQFLTDSTLLTNKSLSDPFAEKDFNWKSYTK